MNHRPRSRTTPFIAAAVLAAVMMFTPAAKATESALPVSVGEVAETTGGVDATRIREDAEGEIREIDLSKLPRKHRYVVSLSVARSSLDGAVSCNVHAMLRDAKTGNMIAIIEAGAQASGTTTEEAVRRVASAAVRSAMRRIPSALAAK